MAGQAASAAQVIAQADARCSLAATMPAAGPGAPSSELSTSHVAEARQPAEREDQPAAAGKADAERALVTSQCESPRRVVIDPSSVTAATGRSASSSSVELQQWSSGVEEAVRALAERIRVAEADLQQQRDELEQQRAELLASVDQRAAELQEELARQKMETEQQKRKLREEVARRLEAEAALDSAASPRIGAAAAGTILLNEQPPSPSSIGTSTAPPHLQPLPLPGADVHTEPAVSKRTLTTRHRATRGRQPIGAPSLNRGGAWLASSTRPTQFLLSPYAAVPAGSPRPPLPVRAEESRSKKMKSPGGRDVSASALGLEMKQAESSLEIAAGTPSPGATRTLSWPHTDSPTTKVAVDSTASLRIRSQQTSAADAPAGWSQRVEGPASSSPSTSAAAIPEDATLLRIPSRERPPQANGSPYGSPIRPSPSSKSSPIDPNTPLGTPPPHASHPSALGLDLSSPLAHVPSWRDPNQELVSPPLASPTPYGAVESSPSLGVDTTPEPMHAAGHKRPPPHRRREPSIASYHASTPNSPQPPALGLGHRFKNTGPLALDGSAGLPVLKRRLTAHCMDSEEDEALKSVRAMVPPVGATDDEQNMVFPTEEEMTALLAEGDQPPALKDESSSLEHASPKKAPTRLQPMAEAEDDAISESAVSGASTPPPVCTPRAARQRASSVASITTSDLLVINPALDEGISAAEDLPTARAKRREKLRRRSKKLGGASSSFSVSASHSQKNSTAESETPGTDASRSRASTTGGTKPDNSERSSQAASPSVQARSVSSPSAAAVALAPAAQLSSLPPAVVVATVISQATLIPLGAPVGVPPSVVSPLPISSSSVVSVTSKPMTTVSMYSQLAKRVRPTIAPLPVAPPSPADSPKSGATSTNLGPSAHTSPRSSTGAEGPDSDRESTTGSAQHESSETPGFHSDMSPRANGSTRTNACHQPPARMEADSPRGQSVAGSNLSPPRLSQASPVSSPPASQRPRSSQGPRAPAPAQLSPSANLSPSTSAHAAPALAPRPSSASNKLRAKSNSTGPSTSNPRSPANQVLETKKAAPAASQPTIAPTPATSAEPAASAVACIECTRQAAKLAGQSHSKIRMGHAKGCPGASPKASS